MTRAIIHIGMPKCASTFLQHVYQKAGEEKKVGFAGFNAFRPLIQQSMHKATDGKVSVFDTDPGTDIPLPTSQGLPIFATNEIFCGIYPLAYRFQRDALMTPQMMRTYQELVADYLKRIFFGYCGDGETHVLIMVRKPEDWLGSVYRNLVTMGLSERPVSYLKSRSSLLAQWYNVDFLYDLYESHFGSGRVHVISIEMLRKNPDAFIDKMDSLLGAPVLKEIYAKYPAPMNQSLPDNIQEVLRRFYEMVDVISPPTPGWLNTNSKLKEWVWRYLHNDAMNSPEIIKKLQALSPDLAFDSTIPESVVKELQANLIKTMALPDMADYRDLYEAA